MKGCRSVELKDITIFYYLLIRPVGCIYIHTNNDYQDNQPATLASFNKPRGIAGKFVNFSTDNSASDTTFLYIADTNNHVIRGTSFY